MTTTLSRPLLAAAALAAAAVLLSAGADLQALQKMAGYASGKTFFKDARSTSTTSATASSRSRSLSAPSD